MLTILVDDAVPFVDAGLGGLGHIIKIPSAAIDTTTIATADVLVVRSVTRVDGKLLDGTNVKLVATATAGTDHIVATDLESLGVLTANAPGCNAMAVVEYILAALAALPGGLATPRTVGVVGYGQIGRRLTGVLRGLGHRVVACDPPLHDAGKTGEVFATKAEVLAAADVITFHVPLVTSGPHPTHHWLDAAALAELRDDALVLNASRGAVVDNAALEDWLARGRGSAMLDVWESEPNLRWSLLQQSGLEVGTPHVAGYSLEGKVRATAMVAHAVAGFAGRVSAFDPAAILGPPGRASLPTVSDASLEETCLTASTLATDDEQLRSVGQLPLPVRERSFEQLRRTYVFRREFRHFIPPSATAELWRLLAEAE